MLRVCMCGRWYGTLCAAACRSVAGEGTDRTDIGLPGIQSEFALAVLGAAHAAKVPVVLLLIHNVSVGVRPESHRCHSLGGVLGV